MFYLHESETHNQSGNFVFLFFCEKIVKYLVYLTTYKC